MECVRQDEGDGGKLWDAMRKQSHVTDGKKAVCTSCENKSQQTKSLWRFPLIIS